MVGEYDDTVRGSIYHNPSLAVCLFVCLCNNNDQDKTNNKVLYTFYSRTIDFTLPCRCQEQQIFTKIHQSHNVSNTQILR